MPKKIPQRMCIACRQMKSKNELFRCCVTPEGGIEIDSTGKKSGRGAYICNSPVCAAKARKHNLLAKTLGVAVESEFYDMLDNNG